METPTVKLQAFLAQHGYGSRRGLDAMIAEGRITVDGSTATVGQRVIGTESIAIDGRTIAAAPVKPRYFLINKPVGIVSTTSDELNRKTVLSLVPSIQERVYPVGRLDVESEGLMLLTNDGELANKMTHPRFGFIKTYRVTVEGLPSEKAIDHLERGVRLKEGYTNAATITNLSQKGDFSTFEISISQGWNQQVRRMCDRVGYPVVRLVRIAFGPFILDSLREKKCIELSKEDVEEKLAKMMTTTAFG
ncbi:rRNA pseudouridine synthase [Candidatus Woesebacteria bacterium]|nr:rRNA pseudouridine synthase [Candidatus Woesebacteria bacterium]